jgi:DNA-binding XRE family transcriptional regulator
MRKPMKVFISWSGSLSHQVALALQDWLPSVLQTVEPYVSSEDIEKGARWSTDLGRELESSRFGIICLTAENIAAPWINFEAGVLATSLERSRVAPLLFGVDRTAVQGPLVQFQSSTVEPDEVRKLLLSIDRACEQHALGESRLGEVFDVWWPHLRERLEKLRQDKPAEAPRRSRQEALAAALELTRGQEKLLAQLLAEEQGFSRGRPPKRPLKQRAPATPERPIGASPRPPKPQSATSRVVGMRVRSARTAQGLTLRRSAELCGLQWSAMSRIERGELSLSLETLLKIAQALGVDLVSLMPGPNAQQS